MKTEIKMTTGERLRRNFSESFKRKKVLEIESKQSKISEICKQYQVSNSAVCKWINKYGTMKTKHERMIVESESDTKKLIAMQKRIAEPEQIIGQKQLVIDFQNKMIEIAEEEYNVDIKKKFGTEPIATTTDTGKKQASR